MLRWKEGFVELLSDRPLPSARWERLLQKKNPPLRCVISSRPVTAAHQVHAGHSPHTYNLTGMLLQGDVKKSKPPLWGPGNWSLV